MAPLDPGFDRHWQACHNASVPGARLRLVVDGHPAGYVRPEHAGALERQGETARARLSTLAEEGRRLARAGLVRWRDEAFDVLADDTGAVLGTLDRGLLPIFGIAARGVHLNGLVRRPDGTFLWVARRARTKALDPGKLDHLAAGGVPAGLSPRETLIKEAAEEASLPPSLTAQARDVGVVEYAMDRPEGLRRDRIHCYDLDLPADWRPVPGDDEVEAFELWPLHDVFARVRDTDDFKFNVNLVLIELFRREGLMPAD